MERQPAEPQRVEPPQVGPQRAVAAAVLPALVEAVEPRRLRLPRMEPPRPPLRVRLLPLRAVAVVAEAALKRLPQRPMALRLPRHKPVGLRQQALPVAVAELAVVVGPAAAVLRLLQPE